MILRYKTRAANMGSNLLSNCYKNAVGEAMANFKDKTARKDA
jgi:hypothetical protein